MLPFISQDPGRSIRDPAICQACDCDRVGSQNNGECESKTDPVNDLVAGRCICKRNVGGNRCDRCKAGFWNRKIPKDAMPAGEDVYSNQDYLQAISKLFHIGGLR